MIRVVLLTVLWAHTAATMGLFEKDGVLVIHQGEARLVSAVWRLVVLIKPPEEPPVRAWANDLTLSIRGLNATRFGREIKTWTERIDAFTTMDRTFKVSLKLEGRRVERSPFDIIGSGMSWLFGTATTSQLGELSNALRHDRLRTTALVHNQNTLLSMVNGTRGMVEHLAQRVKMVCRYTQQVAQAAWSNTEQIADIVLAHNMDQAIAHVEAVLVVYTAQRATFHRQQMLLDRGMLTQELVSRGQLKRVLNAVKDAGHIPLQSRWYFHNARVSPLWGMTGMAAFSIALPLIHPRIYSVYGLKYLPVRIDLGHLRFIVGEPAVAVSNSGIANFFPTECSGEEPMVCWPSLVSTVTTCESALATGGDPGLCIVKLVRCVGRPLTVLTPRHDSSTVAIAPHVEQVEMNLSCPGKPLRQSMISGPTLVDVGDSCVLEGQGWMIKGLRGGNATLAMEPLRAVKDLPSINMSWPEIIHPTMAQQLEILPEFKIPLISFKDIVTIPDLSENVFTWESVSIATKIVISGVIGIVLLGIVVMGYRCQRKGHCRRAGPRSRGHQSPECVELRQVQQLGLQGEPTQGQAPLIGTRPAITFSFGSLPTEAGDRGPDEC